MACWLWGGCRVTFKYRPKTSPREDQIGECSSISFQEGPRGNMDARITPMGSQDVLLGSAFGAQQNISLQVYSVFLLLRTQPTQHRIYTKAPKLRRSGENHAILPQLYNVCCFRRRSRRRTNSAPRPVSYRGRGPKNINCSFRMLFSYSIRSRRRAGSRPSPDQVP